MKFIFYIVSLISLSLLSNIVSSIFKTEVYEVYKLSNVY